MLAPPDLVDKKVIPATDQVIITFLTRHQIIRRFF